MKLRALVLTGALVLLISVATAAFGVALVTQQSDAPRDGMSSMMSPGPDDPDRGRSWGPGMGMMYGTSATELAYLTEMIAHHEEAVTAAGELARSQRPQMRAFGESIIKSQSAQIQQMSGWLAQWYPNQPATSNYRPMMRDLTDLSGDELDRVFLQDMVGHHMMAVMMSQQFLSRSVAEHTQVDDLAVAIRDEQRAEILQMRRWLTDWFGTSAGWMGGGMGMGGWMMR